MRSQSRLGGSFGRWSSIAVIAVGMLEDRGHAYVHRKSSRSPHICTAAGAR